jgi:hypothetical protein
LGVRKNKLNLNIAEGRKQWKSKTNQIENRKIIESIKLSYFKD